MNVGNATSGAPLFKAGALVALRSDPRAPFPVLEALPGGPEPRYRVFLSGATATYYESQLQAVAVEEEELPALSARELHARLTAFQVLSPSTANLDPTWRAWEKWLKGEHPTLPVTFDQETASDDPRLAHLAVSHPLVRQAARALEIVEPRTFSFAARIAAAPPASIPSRFTDGPSTA